MINVVKTKTNEGTTFSYTFVKQISFGGPSYIKVTAHDDEKYYNLNAIYGQVNDGGVGWVDPFDPSTVVDGEVILGSLDNADSMYASVRGITTPEGKITLGIYSSAPGFMPAAPLDVLAAKTARLSEKATAMKTLATNTVGYTYYWPLVNFYGWTYCIKCFTTSSDVNITTGNWSFIATNDWNNTAKYVMRDDYSYSYLDPFNDESLLPMPFDTITEKKVYIIGNSNSSSEGLSGYQASQVVSLIEANNDGLVQTVLEDDTFNEGVAAAVAEVADKIFVSV